MPETAARHAGILPSIDVLRGLVMIAMALDHTRDFFASGGFNPRDVTEPALFLTAGSRIFVLRRSSFSPAFRRFSTARKGPPTDAAPATSADICSRAACGFVLIEITVVRLAWSFSFDFNFFVMQVIFAIGSSMITLSAMVYLPRMAIAAIGLAMIFGHNLLDGIKQKILVRQHRCGASSPTRRDCVSA